MLDKRVSVFMRDNPIFSSEKMSQNDYSRGIQLKKFLVISLKGPDAKTN
jgi:hypothetical protein